MFHQNQMECALPGSKLVLVSRGFNWLLIPGNKNCRISWFGKSRKCQLRYASIDHYFCRCLTFANCVVLVSHWFRVLLHMACQEMLVGCSQGLFYTLTLICSLFPSLQLCPNGGNLIRSCHCVWVLHIGKTANQRIGFWKCHLSCLLIQAILW